MNLLNRVAAVGIAALALGVAFAAPNITRANNLFAPNGSVWDIINDTGAVFDGSSDAFDSYNRLGIRFGGAGNGTALNGFGLTLSGRTHSTTTPVIESGVSITRTLFASSTGNYLRYLNSFTNTTGSAVSFEVASTASGSFGSDAGTQIRATSSGDLILGTNDTYVVSSDSTLSDPPVGSVFQTTGNSALNRIGSTRSSNQTAFVNPYPFGGTNDDGYSFVYSVSLAPGESSTIAYFLFQGVPGSAPTALINEIAAFNPEANGFSDLSPAQRAGIANFNAAPAVVPEANAGLLTLLALPLAGFVIRRR